MINEEITLAHIKAKKKELNKRIYVLLSEFQIETGLVVTRVNITHENIYNFASVHLIEKKITKLYIETELI